MKEAKARGRKREGDRSWASTHQKFEGHLTGQRLYDAGDASHVAGGTPAGRALAPPRFFSVAGASPGIINHW